MNESSFINQIIAEYLNMTLHLTEVTQAWKGIVEVPSIHVELLLKI